MPCISCYGEISDAKVLILHLIMRVQLEDYYCVPVKIREHLCSLTFIYLF